MSSFVGKQYFTHFAETEKHITVESIYQIYIDCKIKIKIPKYQ